MRKAPRPAPGCCSCASPAQPARARAAETGAAGPDRLAQGAGEHALDGLRKRWRRVEVGLQRSARVQGALRRLYAGYVGFAFRTTRWRRIGFESYEADIARGVPRVLCCWHERIAFISYLRDWSDHGLAVLASRHADAQILVRDLESRGIEVIPLASSGDNSAELRAAVRALKAGRSLGITVDGPMGPARQVKPGALVIAGLAGVQATPCAYAVSRYVRLPTWDRFILPLPWSRGVLAVGDGFVPPRRMDATETAAACTRLAALIDDLTARCEAALRDP